MTFTCENFADIQMYNLTDGAGLPTFALQITTYPDRDTECELQFKHALPATQVRCFLQK